ncbi:hypothetical protein DPMN_149873 [Dreissena polymorpha]|uniref:Uncharacterized protein n=1 Tax=Dreissena polymorpha TaxID=45954 RepID=A0A9D4FEL8_DREPO|nr:hypothetical protein DPMN_149873 [Dreissena polymorpha]
MPYMILYSVPQDCYMVVEDKVDFFSAKRDCKSRKSYLLNVDATPELDYVKRLVRRVGRF